MIQLVGLRDGAGACFLPKSPKFISALEKVFIKNNELVDAIYLDERYNVFYTLAHHKGCQNSDIPVRSAASFYSQEVLGFDIDHCEFARSHEYIEVMAEVLKIPPSGITCVHTGNGFQFLIWLQNHISSADFFATNKQAYHEICRQIDTHLAAKGLKGNADTAIFDPARLFRVPGTANIKPSIPKTNSSLVQYSNEQFKIDLIELSGLEKLKEENISAEQVKRNFPQPDFSEFLKECDFIDWVIQNPQEIHEPHVFDVFSLLSNYPKDATVNGHTPETLARQIFDNATSSESLKRTKFEAKWDGASRYGVRTCNTIALKHKNCEVCPHRHKISTPLALKSKEHIGSHDNGFWIMDKKGKRTMPNYADLSKHFISLFQVKTTPNQTVYVYEDNIYKEFVDGQISNWVINTVNPSDELMDRHRRETISRIKAETTISKDHATHFFENSIFGKLNLQNGVLNFETGELLPHSPDYGFRYILPYSYDPSVSSTLFFEWLLQIMSNNMEWVEVVLDVMAYCLWPKYDDHVCVFLIGEGANGKSTLLDILHTLLGRANVSSVPLDRLVGNQFALSQLDSKLVNMAPESSGIRLGYQELNIIKALSSGETVVMERKGKDAIEKINTAKLIFSCNRAPDFKESSHALDRRLLAIPFNFKIDKPDIALRNQLLTDEIPGILTLLIERVRYNIKKNGGFFKINRDEKFIKDATKEFSTENNTTVAWAKECLTSGVHAESFVTVQEAYDVFKNWCDKTRNNSFAPSLRKFVLDMKSFVLSSPEMHARVRDGAGRQIAVFKGFALSLEADFYK